MKRPREHFVPLCSPAEARHKLERHAEQLQRLRASVAQLEKESPRARRVAALDSIVKTQTELLEALQKRTQRPMM